MKTDCKASLTVRRYTDAIVAAAQNYDPEVDIELEYMEALSEDETCSADQAYIVTSLGIILVLPDFKKSSAVATIYNVAQEKYYRKEGFEEDWIDAHAKVFSRFRVFSKANAKLFGYYLTHKL